MDFLQKSQTTLLPGIDSRGILSCEDSCSPALAWCWTARVVRAPGGAEQACVAGWSLALVLPGLVREAPVQTPPCCCFCSAADATKGRQQPPAQLLQQLPVPSQLLQEDMASVG